MLLRSYGPNAPHRLVIEHDLPGDLIQDNVNDGTQLDVHVSMILVELVDTVDKLIHCDSRSREESSQLHIVLKALENALGPALLVDSLKCVPQALGTPVDPTRNVNDLVSRENSRQPCPVNADCAKAGPPTAETNIAMTNRRNCIECLIEPTF